MVWFGLLYTICFLVKPDVVMIITIVSLAIYVVQLVLKLVRNVRGDTAGRHGHEHHCQNPTIEGRVSWEPPDVQVMAGNNARQDIGQTLVRYRTSGRRECPVPLTCSTPGKEPVLPDTIVLQDRITDCTGYRHRVIIQKGQSEVWQDLRGGVRYGLWYDGGRFRLGLQSIMLYSICSDNNLRPNTRQGLDGAGPELDIQKSLSGVWVLFKKLNPITTESDDSGGHSKPTVEGVATYTIHDRQGLVPLYQRPTRDIQQNGSRLLTVIEHLRKENAALKNKIRILCRVGVCSATDVETGEGGDSMSEENRNRLLECCPTLLQDIYPKFLFPHLVQGGVLDWDEVESIEKVGRGTRLDQVKELIRVLHTKDDHAFACLCEALRETEQGFLADMLEGIPSAGSMTKEHREQLTSHCRMLINELQPTSQILDYLIQCSVFTYDIGNEINTARTTTNKNRQLLILLQSRGDGAFQAFCDALREADKHYLADMLEPRPFFEDFHWFNQGGFRKSDHGRYNPLYV